MMKKYNFSQSFYLRFFASFLVFSLILGHFSTAYAQATYPTPYILPPTSNCVTLTYNMRYGARDYFTNGDVSRLQAYLNSRGYLAVGPTGFFGRLTLAAVQRFQRENGLYSAGFVGQYTRERIRVQSCGGTGQTSTPTIYSISPSSGTAGTVVTISGLNFASNSVVLFDSNIIVSSTFQSNNSIRFTVPTYLNPPCYYSQPACLMVAREISLGTHTVSVQNPNGTSNAVTFTVTSTSQNRPPVVNGIDSPTILNVGQTGTWTVRATDVTGGGLSYRVIWGDEAYNVMPAYSASAESYNQSSTFTHTYYSSGVFNPIFIVRGSNGQSVETRTSVTVSTGINNQFPNISSVYPSYGRIGTTITIFGSGFAQTNSVLIGGGAINNVTSSNGTSLSFVLPDSVSPDCPTGMYCAQYQRIIYPGTYFLSVRNSNGTSNGVMFTVTATTY